MRTGCIQIGTGQTLSGIIMPKVLKTISGFPYRFGGKEHQGWLPPNAAKPLPTPVEDVLLDLQIMEEAGGHLLCWASRDGRHHGDLWFQRIEDALTQAAEDFGIEERLWQDAKPTI